MVICPKCGAENGKRNPDPVKCCRCWYQFVRTGNKRMKGGINGTYQDDDAGAGGSGEKGKVGGSGVDAPMPVLRKAKGPAKRLHPVPDVRVNWLDGENLDKNPNVERHTKLIASLSRATSTTASPVKSSSE